MRMPIFVVGLLWGGGLVAQEVEAKPEKDGIRVEVRCVQNAPKGVEAMGGLSPRSPVRSPRFSVLPGALQEQPKGWTTNQMRLLHARVAEPGISRWRPRVG